MQLTKIWGIVLMSKGKDGNKKAVAKSCGTIMLAECALSYKTP